MWEWISPRRIWTRQWAMKGVVLPTTRLGQRELIKWVKQLSAPPVQVICESSGGYERALVQALAASASQNQFGSSQPGTAICTSGWNFGQDRIKSMQRCCANLVR